MQLPLSAHATISCDSQGYATIIGNEIIATQCISSDMSDTIGITYNSRSIECSNGVVTITPGTPHQIQKFTQWIDKLSALVKHASLSE